MNGMTLTIKGLFGHFNYEIPLYGLESVDGIPMSDGVTILTGPNGYGKSTILRILEAIGKGDLKFFVDLKFQSLSLRQDDSKDGLILEKTENKFIMNGGELSFNEIEHYYTVFEKVVQESFSYLNNEVEEQDWDKTLEDLFTQKYGKKLLKEKAPYFRASMIHLSGLSDLISLISEQRLLNIKNVVVRQNGEAVELQKVVRAVQPLPDQLKVHFDSVFSRYSEADTELNASFPSRVLNQSSADRLTEEEFNRLYQDMNDKLRVLRENGLSDVTQQDIPVFQADKAGILRVFFDDFNERYGIYEPLIAKLTLFRKILDRRFRTFKRVEVSRKYGLRVLDIPTDSNGGEIEIPLEKLSSGEQETLALYYQLIFETAPGTMLLIDEPEISLHIAWQRHFIDELKEIVRLNDLRAVVATHSVSILNGNWDIEVNLGELYKNGRAK